MESRKSNLFVGDRSFMQSWNLSFKESSTERKFMSESLRFHWQSLQYLYLWTVALWIYIYYSEEVNFGCFVVCLIVLIMSTYAKDILVKRVILQGACVLWQINTAKSATISECFGLFLPSFVLNFLMLKSWMKSLGFFAADMILVYYQTHACLSHLLVSVFTYTLLISILEKDFRDLWHLYASYKKSNCLHKSLWDTSPGVELLVSSEGKIIHSNRNSLELLKKINRPTEILKGGNFEDFFEEFQEQAKNLVAKAMKGEINEEVYVTKSKNNDYSELNPGFLIIADSLSWVTGNCARIVCMDVSSHIHKKHLICFCLREVQIFMESLSKSLVQLFAEQGNITRDVLSIFCRVVNYFKGTQAINSHFSGAIELRLETFDVNAEIYNIIEMLYLKACQHKVSLTYTREKGIPNTIVGDRGLHNVVIFSLLDYAIEHSMENSEIFILVQVSVFFI